MQDNGITVYELLWPMGTLTVRVTPLRLRSSRHTIMDDWLRTRRDIIWWFIGIAKLSYYTTDVGRLSDIWKEKMKNIWLVWVQRREPIRSQTSTERQLLQKLFPRYSTHIYFYFRYFNLSPPNSLLSSAPNIWVKKDFVSNSSIAMQDTPNCLLPRFLKNNLKLMENINGYHSESLAAFYSRKAALCL